MSHHLFESALRDIRIVAIGTVDPIDIFAECFLRGEIAESGSRESHMDEECFGSLDGR